MMRHISVVLLFTTTLVSLGCASIPGIARKDPSQVSLSDEEKAQLTQIRQGAQSQVGQSVGVTEGPPTANDDLDQPAVSAQTRLKVYLNLVQSMIDRNIFYAAIAHLDALGEQDKKMPEAQFLRAEALRLTKQREAARTIYNTLLGSALTGQARRGLGLLAAEENKLDDAVTHLWQANWLRPTDPKVRNDLGYVLLLRGQIAQAREHLTTALELSRGEGLSAVNMVLLLFFEGQEEGALRLGRSAQLDEANLASLRQRAVELRQQISRRAFVTTPPIASIATQTAGQPTAKPQVPVVSPPTANIAGQVATPPQAAAIVGGQTGTPSQSASSVGGQVVTQPQSAPVAGLPTPPVPAVKKTDQELLVKNSAAQVTSK